jgi:hypothetical protein
VSCSGEAMKLDIRIPIGLLFTLIGAPPVGCGLLNGAPPRGVSAKRSGLKPERAHDRS